MDRHTLEQEAINVARSIDLAHTGERYHEAGARRDHDRATTLELRLEEIRAELANTGDDCDCPA
jgi:hypothetical protein